MATTRNDYIRKYGKEIVEDDERIWRERGFTIDYSTGRLQKITKKAQQALCPLCNDTLDYVDVNGTNIYKCDACPFIGCEFYQDNDLINLQASIK